MDFFETQERYRRREMRGWLVLLVRIALFGGAIWFGWVWGQAEQSSLQAEADLVIYENNVRITELSSQVQSLQLDLAKTKADGMAKSVTGKDNVALRRVIAKKIAAGVTSEQIISSIQTLGNPVNCREVERNDVAVATPLYAGPDELICAVLITLTQLSHISPTLSPSPSSWPSLSKLGQLSQASPNVSASELVWSSFVLLGQLSQASPKLSLSEFNWSSLSTKSQLSQASP